MHISIAKYGGTEDVLTIEIPSDLTIRDFKAVVAAETDFGIEASEMNLYHDGKLLQDDDQILERTNIKDYDVVTCQQIRSHEDPGEREATGMYSSLESHSQQLFHRLRSNPALLQQLRQSDPQLVRAVEQNDMMTFIQCLMNRVAPQQRGQHHQPEVDLFDPTIQRRIEEHITMENVMDNMEHAYEHAPEFFGNVVMLYINCKINSHPVKAFVDSGAQMTIMSKACAERCGIMRLLDTRFSGIARGVGTQQILGRIHLAQLEVEKQFFATSLSILEDQSIDMLIGLDMLRRHRCVIDLDKNVLRIENSVETSFLPEAELPAHARLSGNTPGAEGDDLPEGHLQSAAGSGHRTSNRADNHPPQRSSQAAAAAAATSSPFPENSIKEITKKGFTREQAIEELKSTNGNVTKALVTLMAKSLAKPKRSN